MRSPLLGIPRGFWLGWRNPPFFGVLLFRDGRVGDRGRVEVKLDRVTMVDEHLTGQTTDRLFDEVTMVDLA